MAISTFSSGAREGAAMVGGMGRRQHRDADLVEG
jgi:hypothetical protein